MSGSCGTIKLNTFSNPRRLIRELCAKKTFTTVIVLLGPPKRMNCIVSDETLENITIFDLGNNAEVKICNSSYYC